MNLLLSRNRFISLLIVILCCGFFSQTKAQQSRRKPVVSEVRFDAGNSARGIPFELHNNHIYLSVKVVNSEPLSFILDTGASPRQLNRSPIAKCLEQFHPARKASCGIFENQRQKPVVCYLRKQMRSRRRLELRRRFQLVIF